MAEGPSKSKKCRPTFRNPNKLTDEELLAALMYSSDEEDDLLGGSGYQSDLDLTLEQCDSESEVDDSAEADKAWYLLYWNTKSEEEE
ncbi:unnamed protein product [Acanthoscelides obtectus]|uniref:Uncharacterized protein n=1 Tax=Acanthoscelides obtectus TaxID=200917 RepID=A0A9P0P236_ACAOB|nr:unnamed protein product [Acanthoscelides obtectus]CAK1633787.1 hypothetical protein AOBTE_LOCUS8388 [Acanthoscelides obtectus]